MGHPYRFGIEEEYFLADAETGRSPQGEVVDRFHQAAGDAVEPAEHEFLKGQVEVATKAGDDLDDAYRSLRATRADLSKIAHEHGLKLFAAGSHPLGRMQEQDTTESARYEKLRKELGIIAHRSMVCAMHIHVEVPDPDLRVPLIKRLMPYLPLFLALSVSSPFWAGRNSGLQCARLATFSEWPRMGLPELFADKAEYDRFVDILTRSGTIENASFIWWYIRPSNKFDTVEMRICDSCTLLDDAIAIAALFRALVRTMVRRVELNANVGLIDRGVCAENIWQVQREGIGARLVDVHRSGAIPLGEKLEEVLTLVEEDADALGCVSWLGKTRDILRRGSSAERQLDIFRDAGGGTEALRAVIDELAALTANQADGFSHL